MDSPYKILYFLSGASERVGQGRQGVNQTFFELQTPDFGWKFVWNVKKGWTLLLLLYVTLLTNCNIRDPLLIPQVLIFCGPRGRTGLGFGPQKILYFRQKLRKLRGGGGV